MTAPRVGIVVLNYCQWRETLECLASLLENHYPHFSVFVVDNHSQNGSLDRIADWVRSQGHAPVMLNPKPGAGPTDQGMFFLIPSDQNRGYAAGNNIGIRAALAHECSYILILNSDTLVDKDCLTALVGYMENNPACGIAGPKVLRPDNSLDRNCCRRRLRLPDYFFCLGLGVRLFPRNRWLQSHYYTGEYDFQTPRMVDLVSGSCMLVRRDVFDAIGLLDERTFLYLEEFILYERLRITSYTTAIVPIARIIHKCGRSSPALASRRLNRSFRSSLWYYLRNYRGYNLPLAALLVASGWRFQTAGALLRFARRCVPWRGKEDTRS
jgi:GT2 family glycosyltransferase